MMLLTCRSIPLNSINFDPDWNLHPWEFRMIPTELQEELALNGIIHPPLVVADSKDTFTVVAGTRRVEFSRRFSGLSSIDCMVIAKGAPSKFVLNLILADQSCASGLSLAEKARFVEIASKLLEMGDIGVTFQAKLQLKIGRSTIPNLLEILRQDEIVIKAIHARRIQDKMVSDILSLPQETDRIALVQLFIALGMGDGKQKRFFSLIRDIAYRDGSSISSFLQKQQITEILNHGEMNIPQKILHLGNLLQRELAPASSEAEAIFETQIKNLHLPVNHQISHAPFFEKDEITLSISFKNFTACKQYLDRRQKLTKR